MPNNKFLMWQPAWLLILFLLLLGLGFVAVRQGWVGGEWEIHELSGIAMGTTYSIKLVANSRSQILLKKTQKSVDNRLKEIDGAMSTYKYDSELSRFNRHLSTDPFPVSADVLEVFLLAQMVSIQSNGAFDVTIKPLVDAWGFGPDDSPILIPDTLQLAALKKHTGFQKIVVDSMSSSLIKKDPQVTADLSAIAKGYAVDGVAKVLIGLGFSDFLFELGGELRAAGTKPNGARWVVGIEAPVLGDLSIYDTIELQDNSIATSGDYRNLWEDGGLKFSHIINPSTGWPLPYIGISVTVIHELAVLADAWTTAMSVLGSQTGIFLADKLGLQVIFVKKEASNFIDIPSRKFHDPP